MKPNACKKKAFDFDFEAEKSLKKIKEISIEEKKPVRHYRCLKCGKIHLTSRDGDDFKRNLSKKNNESRSRQKYRIQLMANFFAKKYKWDLED